MEGLLVFVGLVVLVVWAIRRRKRRNLLQQQRSTPPRPPAAPPAPMAQPPSLLPGGNKMLLGAAAAAGAYFLGKKHGSNPSGDGSGQDQPITPAQEQMLNSVLQARGITLEAAAAAAGVQLGARGLTQAQALQIMTALGGG